MAIIVERKKLSFWERLYLPQIISGLSITFRNFLKPAITLQYPDETPILPVGYRGAPTLVKDSAGREKCVSCQLCEFVCPSKAIKITPASIENEEYSYIEKAPKEFKIDMLRCIYCGYCQEVCPENAIVLQQEFSLNSYSRQALLRDKKALYKAGGVLPDSIKKWEKIKNNAKHTEGH